MKTLPRVAAEMALHVLAYNLTRVMNIIADMRPYAVAQPPKTAVIRIRSTSRQKSRHTHQNEQTRPPRRNREMSMLLPGRFHTTKTLNRHPPNPYRGTASRDLAENDRRTRTTD
jgi:hypothetical protein